MNGLSLGVFLLLWIAPIFTWRRVLPGNPAGRTLTAASLTLLLSPLLTLLIHYLPGAVPRWLLLLVPIVVTLIPLGIGDRGSGIGNIALRTTLHTPHSTLYIVLFLLTLLLRLPDLGYKELQGDEGIILVRAASALTGDDAELFLHQKGPIEILLPMVSWGIADTTNDFWTRLPFMWASVLAVGAVVLLAREWFPGRVALLSGGLMAINGFAIAFGRIVQYQSFVMLWGTMAVYHAVRYHKSRQKSHLWLTALFLAGGLLAHYDAILVAPVIAWLIFAPFGETSPWERIKSALPAMALGAVTLSLFYAPFILNPNFANTSQYLVGDRLGGGEGQSLLSWSGSEAWQMATFYNSTYYIVGLILFLIIGCIALVRHKQTFQVSETWKVSVETAKMAPLLFFIAPFLFYLFIVADPRTHIYTFFPAGIILSAYGIHHLLTNHPLPTIHYPLITLFFIISAAYPYLLFTDTTIERQRTWAENRPALYPTTWNEPPQFGLFGFPYQAGWRLVPDLIDDLPYASNEEEEITNVYMAQAPRTHCPNYGTFVRAVNVQDEIPFDGQQLDSNFLQHIIQVNGRETIRIFTDEPNGGTFEIHEAAEVIRWLSPVQVAPPQTGWQVESDVTFGGIVRLLGYDLDVADARPGGQIHLTLYWQPLVPLDRNYQVFTHLFDGTMYGQDDGAPECDINPTTRWEPGQIISDPHMIEIDEEVPAGEIPLLVGLYDLLALDRLTLPNNPDNALLLTNIAISSP